MSFPAIRSVQKSKYSNWPSDYQGAGEGLSISGNSILPGEYHSQATCCLGYKYMNIIL